MKETRTILLVEDREEDVFLILRAFEKSKLGFPVHVARDGAEAIDYLRGEGPFENREEHPIPDLILLDLKMPKVDGFEVLEWLRVNEALRGIPVLVLTSSNQLRDVNRAYELGANSFLEKPADFEGMCNAAVLIRDYWLNAVRMPTSAAAPVPVHYR